MIPFFDIHATHAAVANELKDAFARVLASGHIIMGSELEKFETEFAAYCGIKHCIGVGNGLDALALALRARGIGPGDEVIVPSQTFIATWLAVSMVGATPVPVEIDPGTYGLDTSRIAAALTAKTKGIVPVHLYGAPVDMKGISDIAARHGLFVLEDAAQAHGAQYLGRRAGALGDAAAFSFYPTKNLGALGDGGAIVTNDDRLAADLRRLRNYGSNKKYVHEVAGVNSRLDELQAAFLRVRLRTLDKENDQRRAIAARYTEGLRTLPGITTPVSVAGAVPVYHLYVIRSKQRDALAAYLNEHKIGCLVHYPTTPHMQAAYAELALAPDSLPLARAAAAETLSLPMWPGMSEAQVDTVIDRIRQFCAQ